MPIQVFNDTDANWNWTDGAPLPTGDYDAMQFIDAAETYYSTLLNMFGRLSYHNNSLLWVLFCLIL